MWNQQKNTKKHFKFNDFVLWFPKGSKSHLGKFAKKWFGPYRIKYVLFNNMVLLVTFTNFEPNLVLVNINKLKSCKFIEFEVQDFEMHTSIYWKDSKNRSITKRNQRFK